LEYGNSQRNLHVKSAINRQSGEIFHSKAAKRAMINVWEMYRRAEDRRREKRKENRTEE